MHLAARLTPEMVEACYAMCYCFTFWQFFWADSVCSGSGGAHVGTPGTVGIDGHDVSQNLAHALSNRAGVGGSGWQARCRHTADAFALMKTVCQATPLPQRATHGRTISMPEPRPLGGGIKASHCCGSGGAASTSLEPLIPMSNEVSADTSCTLVHCGLDCPPFCNVSTH